MTSKQRAYLRGLAHNIEPIFQVGKNGVNPELTLAIDEALEARELIKIQILQNCFEAPKDVCQKLSERTHSEPVQVIGKRIVLYRPSKEKAKIQLPK
ncbi:MAG: ribosome assembly RNA-binding protein YhbY [Epulopiscium sp.]|nr:ribosome assembly RNA-binding protein YhbY [Candidatus Epulonipiscium sp.]